MTAQANGLAFTTASKNRSPIEFALDGDTYHFTGTKIASIVLPAIDGDELQVFKAMMEWIGTGLPEDEEARLEARLRDPDDDLDVTDLVDVFKGLVAAVAGRPTPASSA